MLERCQPGLLRHLRRLSAAVDCSCSSHRTTSSPGIDHLTLGRRHDWNGFREELAADHGSSCRAGTIRSWVFPQLCLPAQYMVYSMCVLVLFFFGFPCSWADSTCRRSRKAILSLLHCWMRSRCLLRDSGVRGKTKTTRAMWSRLALCCQSSLSMLTCYVADATQWP